MFVPVVDKNQNPLMPTKPSRARKWIRDKKATPFWKNGVFCVRLNVNPSNAYKQEIAVGVDPGSKKEGFTVKSESHTYLNIQADAHNKVGKKIQKRRELRRGRRSRKCPNRKSRMNRLANRNRIPAGTRARWDWKLRILQWLSKLYPVTRVCVEDIKARTKQHQKKWNTSFSPLEVGKQWFYSEMEKKWELLTLQGWQKESKGRQRSRQGGTVLGKGLVKNTLIKHIKYGLTRLAGVNAKGLFSIYNLEGNQRLTTSAKRSDFRLLTRLNFNYRSGHSSSP